MFKLVIFILSSLIYLVSGSGQLVVLQSPKSIEFSGDEAIDGNDLPQVLAATLGFTIRKNSDWPGITIKDPFGFADVVAVVAVEGISSLGDFGKLPVFAINPVRDESETWALIRDDVLEHYPLNDNKKTLRRVELGFKSVSIDDVSVKYLDKMNEEDVFFLQDLEELKAHVSTFEKEGVEVVETPQVNWFVLSSLHLLSDIKGADNKGTIEAKQLVRQSLIKLGEVLKKATNDRAFVIAVVSDGPHTRRERAAGEPGNATVPANRATVYADSYPAIFNIILWFTVAFIFSLIAISYFIATMDPGRDSIIYRMTSNRMKKDS